MRPPSHPACGLLTPRQRPPAADCQRPDIGAGGVTATHPDVLIVGAGPTGLAAALLLARRGVSVRIIDTAAQATVYSKALAVNSRTLELLHDSGVSARIEAE